MTIKAVKSALRLAYNSQLFHRGFANVSKLQRGETPRREDIDRLQAGWGNSGWSGDSTFLQAACWLAGACNGPILECGSGLSTILISALPKLPGAALYSLEHMEEFRLKLKAELSRNKLAADVVAAPIRSYGEFDWYTIPDDLPKEFKLVICDGPPSQTRGGRYGLLPVMRERIKNALILLDDAERDDEKAIMLRWQEEFGYSVCPLHSPDGTVALMIPNSMKDAAN
jgi:hypothetical protein